MRETTIKNDQLFTQLRKHTYLARNIILLSIKSTKDDNRYLSTKKDITNALKNALIPILIKLYI